MFYVAEAIYNDPLPCTREELDRTLQPAHVAHVAAGMGRGLVLLGGPKAEGGGGFLLLRADSRGEIAAFLDADPLVLHGVQTFRVTPWRILDFPPALGAVFGGSEA